MGAYPRGLPRGGALRLSCTREGIGPVERRRRVIQAKETTYKGLEAEQPGNLGELHAILRGSGWLVWKDRMRPRQGPSGVGSDTDHGGEGQGKPAGQRGRIV